MLADWMKEVDASQWMYNNFLKLYVKAIPRLPNLPTLHLRDLSLNFQLLVALKDIGMLESLSVSCCTFFPDSTDPKFEPNGTLSIKHFELRGVQFTSGMDAIAQLVASPALHTLHTDDWDFFAHLMRLPVTFNLAAVHAPLHISHIPKWERFLNATPSITELRFTEIFNMQQQGPLPAPLLTLPESALPRLRTLRGPACAITHLVPGRPLTDVCIRSAAFSLVHLAMQDAASDARRTLAALELTTAPMKALRVPEAVYLCQPLISVFPQLDTLMLDITAPEAALTPTVRTVP